MAILGIAPQARGVIGWKISATQAAITGTGAIATGLKTIATGGAVVAVANSGSGLPVSVASIYSIAGGTVNVVVVAASSASNAVSGSALNVNCLAIGY